MVPPWLLLGTERRAVLGSAKAELENLLNSKNIMLIDVTETWGILEYRKISGSINNTIDFKEKYNEVKPSKSD
uniref:Thiosulfate sulfurtransferase like domain containing 3 n=1 Tax=Mandrillus leucophaeus TaxID=9568 RepID=A0A2K5YHU3_MANLE